MKFDITSDKIDYLDICNYFFNWFFIFALTARSYREFNWFSVWEWYFY